MTDQGYTPERIDRVLRSFLHYLAVAETPSSAHQLLEPYRPGPTPNTPRSAKQRGHHSDPLRGADVIADIRRAWSELPFGLGRWVVLRQMAGDTVGAIAEQMRRAGRGVRKQDLYAAKRDACEHMAVTLGWERPKEDDVA